MRDDNGRWFVKVPDEAAVTVRGNGEVVTTQPYLVAAGHLVALREGDLAYLRRRIRRMGRIRLHRSLVRPREAARFDPG